jgi:predicted Zn-dependent peptidase
VIGTADVISTVTGATLAGYHASMYVPGNVVLAAAGNLEHDHLLALVSGTVGKLPPERLASPHSRSLIVAPPPPALRFQRKDTEQYHLCLSAPGISRSDKRRFAASLLDAILGGSASSRLFQEIREKRGMAYSVYTFVSQYTDSGQIGLYVGTREENLGPCIEIAAQEIADVAAGNLTAEEVNRAKDNLKGRIMLSMESTSNRMSRLGKSLITGTELLSFERIIAEIDAVEPEQVSELAGVLLAPERLAAAGIGPKEELFLSAVERVNPGLTKQAA